MSQPRSHDSLDGDAFHWPVSHESLVTAMSTGFQTADNLDVIPESSIVRNDIHNLRTSLVEIDNKVAELASVLQSVKSSHEEQVRSIDWTTYTQELSEAALEVKEWRQSIEAERLQFVSRLKEELNSAVSEHLSTIENALQERPNFYDVQHRGVIVGTEESLATGTDDCLSSPGRNVSSQELNDIMRKCNEIVQVKDEVHSELSKLQQQSLATSKTDGQILELRTSIKEVNERIASVEKVVGADMQSMPYWQEAHENTVRRVEYEMEVASLGSQMQEVRLGLASECNARRVAVSDLSRLMRGPETDQSKSHVYGEELAHMSSSFAGLHDKLFKGLETEAQHRSLAINDIHTKLDALLDAKVKDESAWQASQRLEDERLRLETYLARPSSAASPTASLNLAGKNSLSSPASVDVCFPSLADGGCNQNCDREHILQPQPTRWLPSRGSLIQEARRRSMSKEGPPRSQSPLASQRSSFSQEVALEPHMRNSPATPVRHPVALNRVSYVGKIQ